MRPKLQTTIDAEAISKKAGMTTRHILGLHKKEGMPLRPLAAALSWLESRPDGTDEDSDSSTSALRREKIRHTRLSSERIAYALEVEKGLHIPRSEVVAAFVEVAAALQVALRLLESQLPPAVLGLPLNKSAPLAKTYIRQVQKSLADGEARFWKTHKIAE